MPHKSRVRRQTHVGGAPELLGEIEITFSFGTFPESTAKFFPSRARRLFWSRRAPHGGKQAHRPAAARTRNRPAQVHSTSTARWRTCHPVFSQVDGLIGWRRLKRVLPSGLFFADFTKNFRRHCRGFYASYERHGSPNKPHLQNNNPYIAMLHSLPS